MKLEDLKDIGKAPWFAKDLKQMGPVVALLFLFVGVFVYDFRTSLKTLESNDVVATRAHDKILDVAMLSNHFLWAQCVNEAEDDEERNRCIPPPEKRTELHSYLYETPVSSRAVVRAVQVARAESLVTKEEKTATGVRINSRMAEEIAEEQKEKHAKALMRQGLPIEP